MSKKLYDTLKVISIILPYVATFVGIFGETWGIPYSKQISETLIALTALLVSVLKALSDSYFKDKDIVDKPELPEEE